MTTTATSESETSGRESRRDEFSKVECAGCTHFSQVGGTTRGICELASTRENYYDAYQPWVCPYCGYFPVVTRAPLAGRKIGAACASICLHRADRSGVIQ